MFTEVVAAHESLAAACAREPLLTGVRLEVSLQLVGTCERLAAEQPRTGERPLAGVPAQVRLEVRRLAVDLAAAGHVADVLATSSWRQRRRRRVDAVGTTAALAAPRPEHDTGAACLERGRETQQNSAGTRTVGLVDTLSQERREERRRRRRR